MKFNDRVASEIVHRKVQGLGARFYLYDVPMREKGKQTGGKVGRHGQPPMSASCMCRTCQGSR